MSNVLLLKTFTFKSIKGEGIPLGLLYISAALKKDEHNVSLVDFALLGKNNYEYLNKEINSFNPNIIGITCNTHERFSVIEVANYIKSNFPKILVTVGGPHITLLGEEMMKNCSAIDVAVIEDGEKAMLAIAKNSDNPEEIKNIPGIFYRHNVSIIKNEIKEIIIDLDDYGHPDLDIVDINNYSLALQVGKGIKAISICTSRGCPFRCSFCAATLINYGRVRYHSAQWILDEVKRCLEKYGNDYAIFFYDDHFLLNKKRILEFCQLVKNEGLHFRWGCYSRVDVIDDEVLQNIKDIGCIMLTFGIESGSNKILKLMNKNITSQKIIAVIKKIKSYGIKTRGSFIFGYPGENILDIAKTYWMIFRSDFEIHELVYSTYTMIYPKTKIDKYLPVGFNWHYNYPESELKQFVHVPVFVPPFDLIRRRFTFVLFLLYKYYKKLKKFCEKR